MKIVTVTALVAICALRLTDAAPGRKPGKIAEKMKEKFKEKLQNKREKFSEKLAELCSETEEVIGSKNFEFYKSKNMNF